MLSNQASDRLPNALQGPYLLWGVSAPSAHLRPRRDPAQTCCSAAPRPEAAVAAAVAATWARPGWLQLLPLLLWAPRVPS